MGREEKFDLFHVDPMRSSSEIIATGTLSSGIEMMNPIGVTNNDCTLPNASDQFNRTICNEKNVDTRTAGMHP